MTFLELQTMCYQLLREKSTNTSVDATTLKALINTAYIITAQFLPWKYFESITTKKIPYSAVTTWTSATSVTVADGTDFFAGQTICVYSPTRFDYAVIASKATNVLTLVSPGIPYTHTTASYVAGISFVMPENVAVHQIKYRYVTSADAIAKLLVGIDRRSADKDVPYVSSAGEPTVFYYDIYSSTATGQTFQISPIPNKVGFLDIHYRTNALTALSGDSDAPVIDLPFHSAIGFYALLLLGFRNKDQFLMKYAQDMFVTTMTLAQNMFANRLETNGTYDFIRGIES